MRYSVTRKDIENIFLYVLASWHFVIAERRQRNIHEKDYIHICLQLYVHMHSYFSEDVNTDSGK